MEKNHKKMLRHIVIFGFNPEVTPAQIKEIEEGFCALPSKISEIVDFEWGLNSSPEDFSKGLTHCFQLTFMSDADRDAYLIHPDHQAFATIAFKLIGAITVVDYWVE